MSHQFCIGDYILDKSIGSGATGKVKLARHKDTGTQVAIKIIKKEIFKDHPTLLPKVQREIALMRLLNHPNILTLLDVLESEHHIFIVEGYAEHGSLYDVIQSLPRSMSITFFRQIIFGLEYLHNHGIAHRDLKPENLLLDYANQLWIADFGFACWMPNNVANTSCGSPLYAAPEVIKGIPYNGRNADVWSAGVILYAMLTKTLPFNAESVRVTTQRIKKGIYTIPNTVDPDFQDLIRHIFVVDPRKRYTIEQIKAHPAFRMDVSPEYILPSPFPLPHLSKPIQIGTDEEYYVQCLQQIGFSDTHELKKLLTSNTPNMAKVFYFMLTERKNIDSIPWDLHSNDTSFNRNSGYASPALVGLLTAGSINDDDDDNDNNDNSNGSGNGIGIPSSSLSDFSSSLTTLGSTPDTLMMMNQINNGSLELGIYDHGLDDGIMGGSNERMLDFAQGTFPSSSSASFCRSFENAEVWLGGNLSPQLSICDKHVIHHINTNALELMTILQKFLLSRYFEFFHPDYEQLVARNTQLNIAVTIIGDYEDESHMELSIQLNSGPADAFQNIVRQISMLLSKMIDYDFVPYEL